MPLNYLTSLKQIPSCLLSSPITHFGHYCYICSVVDRDRVEVATREIFWAAVPYSNLTQPFSSNSRPYRTRHGKKKIVEKDESALKKTEALLLKAESGRNVKLKTEN